MLAFFATFLIGGLTGVMLAAVPINIQVHDSFFVVAHLHYVLIGGALFPLLGGLTHCSRNSAGACSTSGSASFRARSSFLGFNVAFIPQHLLGLRGMPRRIYTYLPSSGWGFWNLGFHGRGLYSGPRGAGIFGQRGAQFGARQGRFGEPMGREQHGMGVAVSASTSCDSPAGGRL